MLYLYYLIVFTCSCSMLFSTNPIYAVLFLISIFFCTSFIFIELGVDFLGFIFLMVYVGAIAVLFLFVVMMLDIKKIEKDNTTYLTIGFVIFFLLIIQLFLILFFPFEFFYLKHHVSAIESFDFINLNYNDEGLKIYIIQRLGFLIYNEFFYLLFLAGDILLVAMIGSIFLTNEKRGYSMKRQFGQLSRNNYIFHSSYY